jgi:poly(A) polymerase
VDCSFSALDAYFGVAPAPICFDFFDGDLVDLAKQVDNLAFPGLPYADAIVDDEATGLRMRYRCLDGGPRSAFMQTRLSRLPGKNAYDARGGVYEHLVDEVIIPEQASPDLVIFEAAVLASRYAYRPDSLCIPAPPHDLAAEYQRDLLDLVLTGAHPDKGLELLEASGFMRDYWPELGDLIGVTHSKEFHPEGDAWRHTMETFAHRKNPELILSLGLLLHDTGKPDAVASGGRRFDQHSELGEQTARSFMRRLGYPRALIESTAFLVRYHMLPAALPRVPPSSLGGILDNPLFPTLLELYRCDELSTFRGPDGYYEACAAYKAYQKNSRNPYRGPDGKHRAESLHSSRPRGL